MTFFRHICLFLVLLVGVEVVHTQSPLDLKETTTLDQHMPRMDDGTRWEALEDVAHKIEFHDMHGVKQSDIHIFYLWGKYNMSSRSERAEIVKEIRETYTYIAHMEKSIDMIGFLLFGPQHGRTIIHSVRSSGQPVVDDWECYRSTIDLFERHCGLITEHTMGRLSTLAFANICNKRVDKEAVEEAFKLTCSTKINIPYHMV